MRNKSAFRSICHNGLVQIDSPDTFEVNEISLNFDTRQGTVKKICSALQFLLVVLRFCSGIIGESID